MISLCDRAPADRCEQSPPICGHPESVSVSTYSDYCENCERKIKSSQNHNFDRSFAPVTPERSAVMTLDSRGILIYLRFSEYATTSWGQRAGSGDVGNRFLDLSPSKSVMWPPPPPPAELAVGQVGSPCVIHSSRGIFLFSPLLQTF